MMRQQDGALSGRFFTCPRGLNFIQKYTQINISSEFFTFSVVLCKL
jgi:hypothetical protein